MHLKLITLTHDPDQGGFPSDPLADIEGEVLSVVEHFFYVGNVPQLLLMVQYRPYKEPQQRTTARYGTDGLRAQLADSERSLYDRLRAWRNGRALADGIPSYTILTNRQIVDIIRQQPRTAAELSTISGIGDAKMRRFGSDILATVASLLSPPPSPPLPPQPPPAGPRAG